MRKEGKRKRRKMGKRGEKEESMEGWRKWGRREKELHVRKKKEQLLPNIDVQKKPSMWNKTIIGVGKKTSTKNSCEKEWYENKLGVPQTKIHTQFSNVARSNKEAKSLIYWFHFNNWTFVCFRLEMTPFSKGKFRSKAGRSYFWNKKYITTQVDMNNWWFRTFEPLSCWKLLKKSQEHIVWPFISLNNGLWSQTMAYEAINFSVLASLLYFSYYQQHGILSPPSKLIFHETHETCHSIVLFHKKIKNKFSDISKKGIMPNIIKGGSTLYLVQCASC